MQELIKYKTVVVYESVNDSLSFAHAHTTADKANNNNIIICHTIVGVCLYYGIIIARALNYTFGVFMVN